MPIYEYRCGACEARLEKLQKVTDAPITDCPACGRPRMIRLVSLAGFRLKGGGWYESDFKRNNRRNMAGDSPPAEGKEKPEKSGEKEEKSTKTGEKGSESRASKPESGTRDSSRD